MLLQLETTNPVFKNTNAYNSLHWTTLTEMACNEKVIMCVFKPLQVFNRLVIISGQTQGRSWTTTYLTHVPWQRLVFNNWTTIVPGSFAICLWLQSTCTAKFLWQLSEIIHSKLLPSRLDGAVQSTLLFTKQIPWFVIKKGNSKDAAREDFG